MEKLLFVPNYLSSCSLGVYYFHRELCFLCVLTANNRVISFFLLRCCFYGIFRISESLRSTWRLAGIKLLIIKTLFAKKKLGSSETGQAALRENGFYDKTFCEVGMVEQWVVEIGSIRVPGEALQGESTGLPFWSILHSRNDRRRRQRNDLLIRPSPVYQNDISEWSCWKPRRKSVFSPIPSHTWRKWKR